MYSYHNIIFYLARLLPVHWHVGAEHYSVGEFDEKGNGPIDFHEVSRLVQFEDDVFILRI